MAARSEEPPFLALALRRLRLVAALARAEQGGALTEAEVASLRAQQAAARAAEAEARAQARAAGVALPIDLVKARLALSALDEELLLAAVALEADPLFALAVTALAGEEPQRGLSPRLFAQLFGAAGDEALALVLHPSHPLVETQLLESAAPVGLVETLRPFRAPSRTVSFLAGRDEVEPLVARVGGLVEAPPFVELLHVEEPLATLSLALASGEDVIVLIEGPEGAGRRTLAAEAARRAGRQAVAIDAGRMAADPVRFGAELRALRRECWLRGAVPIVARVEQLARHGATAARFPEIAEALESGGAMRGAAVVTASPGAELPDFRRRVVRVRIDVPGAPGRARLWHAALGGDLRETAANGGSEAIPRDAASAPESPAAPAGESPLSPIAERYRMTPGVILRSAANARMLARGRALSASDVHQGVAAEIHERFGSLATRLVPRQRWEDLVLPADTLDEVKAFIARAANAATVYEAWGFRKKLSRGLGLAALFSGPPGTGKTMVAGLIARTLGLDLYLVDLSQVVSKWVGETEKQLGRIFEAAAMGQALLLFDEADSLFAKRTEVKSSNDRYANLEVNYLLQRIEEFGGVAILTTNQESAVDPAFKRRLAAEVRFYPPEREERERLFRTLLPPEAPTEGALDFFALADAYKDLCGGHIRNVVLRAAFLAAEERRPISQALLARAAKTEYRAMGKVV